LGLIIKEAIKSRLNVDCQSSGVQVFIHKEFHGRGIAVADQAGRLNGSVSQ
jgi:hypothetical protein